MVVFAHILRCFSIIIVLLGLANQIQAQPNSRDIRKNKGEHFRKGKIVEHYKNGNIKSESFYHRRLISFNTRTYRTIREYDMAGNKIRVTKKVIMLGKNGNAEKVLSVRYIKPKKPLPPSETPQE